MDSKSSATLARTGLTREVRWQLLLIGTGIALVGFLLTRLALNYTIVIRPGQGGTYVEGMVGFPRTLNPLLALPESPERDVCALIFSGLTRMNGRGEVEPDLARRWEITASDTVVTYTFYIRSDAYWHDNVPVTAQDVLFTVRLLQDPAFPGPPEFGSMLWRIVAASEIDTRTIQFVLPVHYAPFLDYTAVPLLPAHILSGTTATDLPNLAFNLNPVGTGPFAFEEAEISDGVLQSVVLKQAPTHRGPRPYLDHVQFRFYPDHEQLLAAYREGEVTGIAALPSALVSSAYQFPTLNLYSVPLPRYSIVFLNLRRTDLRFFQEKEVRQALLYAVDRQRIIDEVLHGQAVVAHGPLIPGTWAYRDDLPRYEYNPEKANELLNRAGWVRQAVGDRTRRKEGVWFRFTLLTSDDDEHVAVANYLAQDWISLGISVTVKATSPMEMRRILEQREFEAALVELSLPGDPDPYPFWHETQVDNGQNYAGFVHRRMSEVTELARILVAGGQEQRRELYFEFQQIFAEELPALPLFIPVYSYGVDDRIHNVQLAPLMQPADRFRTIRDWWLVPRRIIISADEGAAIQS